MESIKIKPASEGLKVPFPMSRNFLKEKGQTVEKSGYWIRRLKEGCVVICKEEKKEEKKEEIKKVAKKTINKKTITSKTEV
tara:strand:+ start:7696 stop:7938 length:243 start_codon:yes stop_codon:yes gene_type:complete